MKNRLGAKFFWGGGVDWVILSLAILGMSYYCRAAETNPDVRGGDQVYFSAVFRALQGAPSGETYKISVQTHKDSGDKGAGGKGSLRDIRAVDPSRLQIQIRAASGKPYALCAVRGFESTELEDSMDLRCEANGLAAFATDATVVFTPPGSETPRLRFGTWLAGYTSVPLKVEVNKMSRAPVATTGPDRQLALSETASPAN